MPTRTCKEPSEWVCSDWIQCTYDFVNPFTVRKEVRLLINADLFLSAGREWGGERNPQPNNPLLVLTTLVFARRLRRPIDAGLLTGFGNRPVRGGPSVGRLPHVQRERERETLKLPLFIVIAAIKCGVYRSESEVRIQGRICEFFAPPPHSTFRHADKRGCKYPLWDAGLIASRRVGRVGVGPGLGQRSTSGPLMCPRCRLSTPTWLPTLLAKRFSLSFARFHFYSRPWCRDVWIFWHHSVNKVRSCPLSS